MATFVDTSSLSGVKNIVLILSGKGGVGKSSVTTQLALSLCQAGKRVGVLDIDLTGPSVPRMFGVEGKQVHQASGGWVPVVIDNLQTPTTSIPNAAIVDFSSREKADRQESTGNSSTSGSICVMSIGFLISSRSTSVVWRGPKKTAMIRQFLTDVMWGELDYLLIDTPPGTSDEHISVVEKLKQIDLDFVSRSEGGSQGGRVRGAVIVTTPQQVSLADVRKELSFCQKTQIDILGVVENMSGYICPCCGEVTNIFSTGGGEAMAQEYGVKFLGKVGIDPSFTALIEEQQQHSQVHTADVHAPKSEIQKKSLLEGYLECGLSKVFQDITAILVNDVEEKYKVAMTP